MEKKKDRSSRRKDTKDLFGYDTEGKKIIDRFYKEQERIERRRKHRNDDSKD